MLYISFFPFATGALTSEDDIRKWMNPIQIIKFTVPEQVSQSVST